MIGFEIQMYKFVQIYKYLYIRMDSYFRIFYMPIKASAIKDLRKNKKRAFVNAGVLAQADRLVRQARKAITAKGANVTELLANIQKAMDKAVARGIMKQNTAARVKSRLAARLRGQKA